jgi:outer membrane protein
MKKFRFKIFVFILAISLFGSSLYSQTTKKLSLDDCIKIALKNNTSIVSAKSYSKIAQAGLKSSIGNFLPTIGAYSQWQQREQNMYTIRFDQLVTSKESYYYQVRLDQPIFTGFRNYATLKQSKAENERYKNNLTWTQQTVVLDVKLKYYNVLKNEQLLKVAEDALETSNEELNRIDAMEKIGVVSRAEVYQQKVRVGEYKLALVNARNAVINAKTYVNHTLGIEITEEIDLIPEQMDVDVNIVDVDFDKVIEEALQNRLDFKSYQNNLTSTKSNVTIQRSAHMPTISFFGNYSWWDVQFPQSSRDIDEFDTYSFGVSMNLNLFNGLKTSTNIQQAKAQVVAAEADLEQAKRQVILDVKQAVLEIEKAKENIEVTNENINSAEEDYRLASERYRIGAGTLIEQLTAQNSLTRARVNRIQAIYDYKYAITVLDLAIGKLSW